ncbi:hypothetical protein CAPTEDRAFT_4672 [Capitella teleta]|uniref:Small ribosomal subunit protein RACK1 n=1 Tax=Capitella teleta TaxID=283909 RepID=R7UI17_CAPTE|nr:hypothetical protein CAPTEDRAFT_4672 [Capitella teleta]|eukprot:ELU05860.1 hypothetical protein CAPTEDRAFT_4672 [Capitella teleta]
MGEQMALRTTLIGHGDWVTQVATTPGFPDALVSASRDKALILWKLSSEDGIYGRATKCLKGHEHFVSDVVLSSDASVLPPVVLLDTPCKDVMSVVFSTDLSPPSSCGTPSVSASTPSKTRATATECPASGSLPTPRTRSLFPLDGILKTNHYGHSGYLNCVTVSPGGSLCASGGKDGQAMLWDLNEGKHLYTLDGGGDTINALTFSPNRYWLCAATDPYIKIWDLKNKLVVDELRQEVILSSKAPECTSLAWSEGGQTLVCWIHR